MAKVLISCIGTGRRDINDRAERKYVQADYQFDDGEKISTSFVADALVQHYHIDKIILLGTVKSMWEQVYEKFAELHNIEIDENYWVELDEFCNGANSNSELTIPHKENIEKVLGEDSHIELIRYGFNKKELEENTSIFLNLEKYLNERDELYIDITHSFRSIPLYMMNLLIYLLYVSNKKISIKNISYGMLEARPELGYAPVIDLTDIITINNWLVGAYSFKEFGNAKMIANLMRNEQRNDASQRLETFTEVMQLGYLDGINRQLNNLNAMKNFNFSPIANYILPQTINEYIKKFTKDSPSHFQFQISRWYFEHQNYACSYLSLLEAIITHVQEICNFNYSTPIENSDFAKILLNIKRNNNKYNETDIKKYKQKLIDNSRYSDLCQAAQNINTIRNGIAHQQNISKAKNSSELISTLRQSINSIASIFNEIKYKPKKQKNTYKLLLNLSNHPLSTWTEEQLQTAKQQFGDIQDLPFPQVSPEATEQDIEQLAQEYLLKIQTIGSPKQVIIHLMGELNFTYVMVNLLKQNGYTCVASTTKRIVKELPDNQKISEFHFVKFRKY